MAIWNKIHTVQNYRYRNGRYGTLGTTFIKLVPYPCCQDLDTESDGNDGVDTDAGTLTPPPSSTTQ